MSVRTSRFAVLLLAALAEAYTTAAPEPSSFPSQALPNLSPPQMPNATQLSGKFFRTTITRNKEPLLAEAYFRDAEDNLIVQGPPLAVVIAQAYALLSYQIVDGPEWIYQSHLYDINATPPPTFIEADEAEMLQAMLVDRFALKTQPTMREVTMLSIVVDDSAPPFDFAAAETQPQTGNSLRRNVDGSFDVVLSMDSLGQNLKLDFEQPARNLTNVHGTYAFTVNQDELSRSPRGGVSVYMGALRHLGLKVETRTAPLEVLSITHIAQPHLDD